MIYHLIESIVCSLITSLALLYMTFILLEKRIDFKNINYYKILFCETIIVLFSYYITDNFIRVIYVFFIGILLIKKYLKFNLMKIAVCLFTSYLILLVSEILFSIFIIKVLSFELSNFKNLFFANIFSNIIVASLALVIFNIKIVKSSIINFIDTNNLKYDNNLFAVIMMSILILSMLIYMSYFEVTSSITLILDVFIIIIYIFVIFILIKEKINNNFLAKEKEVVVGNLEYYENLLNKQRIRSHEHKNILISIKGMIEKKDENTNNFINEIIKELNEEDDLDLIMLTKSIPNSGLQKLIYQKLLFIKNEKIKFFVDIDRKIKQNEFDSLSIASIKDICMITGVFIDNSIQAVANITDKMISIQIYKREKNIVIEISNTYEGKMNLNLFDKSGYTTKSDGHGYGLSLVKSIINNNEFLYNEREINGNLFIQKLIIKK